MTRHANQMDAKAYWRQFATVFRFEARGDAITGTIVSLEEEGPAKDPEPRLVIQTEQGDRYSLLATQERLKASLKAECPAVGDWVGIRYLGEDTDNKMAGRNPAKLFKVEVRRKGSQLPGGTGPSGTSGGASGESENAPGAGK